MRNTDIFGLGAVDACCPGSSRRSCNANTSPVGNSHIFRTKRCRKSSTWSPGLNVVQPRPDAVDNADAFMSQDPARCTARHVALQDMQVGSANRRLHDLDDGVVVRLDNGLGPFLQGFLAGAAIDQSFHGQFRMKSFNIMPGWRVHVLTPINLSGGCQPGNFRDG